ncbi:uncharacterized protein LOC108733798 isoform X2 [Agrilus planipennis]|uniref:Uncharacterized protein LOC108733798 isoform X2 n=1 Tax=Agrilus planipennis TaxID=224129 RepID=A0A7F5RHX8_AGRPL|nr:uncharacterized protein LOC108733798 isoform X2 [Agrilus planipennis]
MSLSAGFEVSAMKASFSMSSLQAPEMERDITPRLCNSLTKKKRKEIEHWRRSWGSSASDQKDDFWSALQANYNYIMDNQLIDNCQEANGELNLDKTWSLIEFYTKFSELYSWLNSVQEAIFSKELSEIDKELKAHYSDEVVQKNSLRNLFNEQASQLVQLHPDVKEEVTRRVMHINSKWDSLQAALGLTNSKGIDQSFTDINAELKCLRNWMKSMESRLQPLVFRVEWSKPEIEKKMLEHMVLHRDIESHGKIVTSVVKLCKRRGDVGDNEVSVRRVARSLERRWHLLFLRSLEWQCYFDSLSKKLISRGRNTPSVSSDSDYDEPISKYPRLNEPSSMSKSTSADDNCYTETESNKTTNLESSNAIMVRHDSAGDLKVNYEPKEEIAASTVTEASSHFTEPSRKGKNLATYYFKHEDTDCEMKQSKVIEMPAAVDESSEEEWTYTNKIEHNNPKRSSDRNEIRRHSSSKNSYQNIHRLVQKAEELVRETPLRKTKCASVSTPVNKISRVKEWLNMDRPDDSCDASCEDEEKESQTSEDLNESITTCKPNDTSGSHNDSFNDLNKSDVASKVVLRQKKCEVKANRPWSVSCISQLSQLSPRIDSVHLSISESALNRISLSPKYCKSLTTSATSIGMHGNSTSSTMEECGAAVLEERTSPNRRKRLKLKRKSSSKRRSEVNDQYCLNTASLIHIVKSDSFSGCGCKVAKLERHAVSDPCDLVLGYSTRRGGRCDTSNTSGAESEDDRQSKRTPNFKIGAATSYLGIDLGDCAREKNNLNLAEEQSSSLSEQAWDSYQEKYLSEAYSEAHDSDAARKLLNFGEDYRIFLDSQSDWSSPSMNFENSPQLKRKTLQPFNALESESDSENVKHFLKESRSQLLYTTNIYKQQFNMGLKEYLVANSGDELLATCDQHIYCLNVIEKSPEEFSFLKMEKNETNELMMQWQKLRDKVNIMQEYRNLQKEMLLLKDEVRRMNISVPSETSAVKSIEDISRDIDLYRTELANLDEYKKKLLTFNVSVHRFTTENKDYNSSTLKADISELYRLWNDYHSSASERLMQLNRLLDTWQMLERSLEKLHGDLLADEKTLGLLDSALQEGSLSDQMAVYVREVAKVLSETRQESDLPAILTEGSLSDSGISDEGSEHELGERERRLACMRRLVRQLELEMAPDCIARTKMTERLLAAEEELRALQKRCRSLIVRTAVTASTPVNDPIIAVKGSPGDPDDDPTAVSWFKRVVRASVPFQLAIVALLCVACLLAPKCCDNMNTFSMSLTPQLRYVRGPPPA